MQVDPLTLAVVSSTLESTIREMTITLRRVARSPIFVIGHDFSDCLFDWNGRLIAMGQDQPVHLGAMSFGLRQGVLRQFAGDTYPGDIMYHNDPGTGASHLPDLTVYKPIFYQDQLLFWAVSRGHVNEIGGPVPGGYNPTAEDIFAEGLRISPIKIYERGKPRRDVIELIGTNVRTKREFLGDMGGQIAAVGVAERRLQSLVERYGVDVVKASIEELLERGRRVMREELAKIPAGTYHGTGLIDNDGFACGQIEIRATVTVDEGRIHVSLEAPSQVPHPINSYEPNTMAGLLYGVLSPLSPAVPRNEGAFSLVQADLGPKGTVVNAVEPAACGNSTGITIEAVCDAVTDALNPVIPHRAFGGASTWATYSLSGIDPRNGEFYNYTTHLAGMGGGGAGTGVDGWHCGANVTMGGAAMTGDIELVEYRVPFTIWQYELREDSACPGRWRGGLGSVYEVEVHHDDAFIANTGDGSLNPPLCALGSRPYYRVDRKKHSRFLLRTNGEKLYMPTNSVFRAGKGDRIIAYQGGGGGVGLAVDRPVERVIGDVRNGMISVEAAREEYGVVLDPETLEVDQMATEQQRASLRVRLLAAR